MSGESRKQAGTPSWMVTFADMMTLLLALFVLMLSMSVMDAERYKRIAGAMRDSFGLSHLTRLAGVIELDGSPGRSHRRDVVLQPVVPGQPEAPLPSRAMPRPASGEHSLVARLRTAILPEPVAPSIRIFERNGEAVVSFPDAIAFPSGSAALSGAILPALDRLARVLERTEGVVTVAGHTDSVPIANARFRSNWDLSSARAASVVQYLLARSSIRPERLVAQGHADSRPVTDNDTPVHRAANRRVEISTVLR